MAITTSPVELMKDKAFEKHMENLVRPSQIASAWQTVIGAGLMDDDDNSTSVITNPGSPESSRDLVRTGLAGTTLLVTMQYDDGVTSVSANSVIEVFGRCLKSDNDDPWQRLYNKEDTPVFDVTMTIDITNDVTDGTDKWTKVDAKVHAFDLLGCNELLFLVKTLLNTDANDALAKLLAKVI